MISSPQPSAVPSSTHHIDSVNDVIPLGGAMNKGIVSFLIFVLNLPFLLYPFFSYCTPQRKLSASSLLAKTTTIIFKYLLP
jgi:hypothetical protein